VSGLTSIRLAAVLVPAALLLHEGVYLFAGSPDTGTHGYLATALPVLALLAASLVAASLLLPIMRPRSDAGAAGALRPFLIAGTLLALFGIQESAEILLFGGGLGQLAAVLTGSWLLLPLALLLGTLGTALADGLERAGEHLAALVRARPEQARRRSGGARLTSLHTVGWRSSPLAFGIACRPPPSLG
jgi:hypothetical protein